ncbi:NlpC/P60 family protein [Leptotrichia alba]|uniref:NlpC/P60 family protein n=1 Tax=Leptotrichia alba TaxID=3239304 RepID=A0AB39V322_9FUSO
MVRKSTFTMACMLLTVGCTGLQTSENKTGEKSDSGLSTRDGENNGNITIEVVGGKTGKKKEKSIPVQIDNNEDENTNIKISVTEKSKKDSDKIDTKASNLKVTKLFDENLLVDRSMPNSQLVLQKLSELKKKHQAILKNGTESQKKTVALQNQLLQSYSNWKGTKYTLGGDSATGIDCSALTRRVYREVYGYELPRKTDQQVKIGSHVSKENLKPGDIVFFRPEERVNHTAVYLGESLFINASSAKGVVISTLENTYWNKYFKYGVRVRTV